LHANKGTYVREVIRATLEHIRQIDLQETAIGRSSLGYVDSNGYVTFIGADEHWWPESESNVSLNLQSDVTWVAGTRLLDESKSAEQWLRTALLITVSAESTWATLKLRQHPSLWWKSN
jgi:hypothetical protein